MNVAVRGLSKQFGSFTAVDRVSFELKTGSLTALLGPSGSGKSTVLRMIGGLERPDAGDILIGDTKVSAGPASPARSGTAATARQRNVGFVFQHYALFRHMSVWDNIAFGLDVRRVARAEQDDRVAELVRLVQLEGMERRLPNELSGGQRQRVALARALAPRPTVLLLDEPFGALDAKVRDELRVWIRKLHQESHLTTLFVTHDQHEALEIAHQVIVMQQGRVEQAGTPEDIFERPATPFVAEFVGESNYLEGAVEAPGLVNWGPLKFSVTNIPAGRRVRIYFRPNDVYVTSERETLQVPATIIEMRFRGPISALTLDLGGGRTIAAHMPRGVAHAAGFAPGRAVHAGITGFTTFPIG